MRLFKERDIVCVCVCPNCPLKRSRNNYQSSHSGQEKEMNKIGKSPAVMVPIAGGDRQIN